jgi:DNA-binding NarL/FixJ family response regulator
MMLMRCPYHVVLADDYAVFRHALKRLLLEKSDLEVVGETGDGLELLEFLSLLPSAPDLAIVDICMPNLGGIEATSRIRSTYPDMKVLILSMHREKQYVHAAMSAGADGYLLKENAGTELLPAIERIRQGRVYFSPHLSESDSS